jgi:Mn-dependent DtxR family transcriptional regulator
MNNELINKAIKIAQENKENFGVTLLKRRLHIGLVTANELIFKLEELGIIKNDIKK